MRKRKSKSLIQKPNNKTREVKFINGPFKDKILTLFNKISKLVIPAEHIEYKISQDEKGQWIGKK